MSFDLSPQRQALLDSVGNLIVLGGPGAGKTTIALLKAAHEIENEKLKNPQKILFLSFARATVARIVQKSEELVNSEARKHIEINTYHGFIWKLLKSHGYLLNSGSPIKLLPPPQAAVRLAEHKTTQSRENEIKRLLAEEHLIHFDLFAPMACELLHRSKSLRNIYSKAYPIIILDEFQDTDIDEWKLIELLGENSRLVALADPEQRIYEFRGADAKRIGEFVGKFSPTTFDFGTENFRSNGTDIVQFGNDLLHGKNKANTYSNVTIERYGFYRGRNTLFQLKCAVLTSIKRLNKNSKREWSLAILVPTKRMMLQVSEYLDTALDGLPQLYHDVALDTEAPALAASLIASLLEGGDRDQIAQSVILNLCQHIRGRKGNESPPQGELDLAGALGSFIQSGSIRGTKRKRIVDGARAIADARIQLNLIGNPEQDWIQMRKLLSATNIDVYMRVADDSRYIRLLHRSGMLRSRLNEIWRETGSYSGAVAAVEDALSQEHFVNSMRDWRGIHVMTIHKSKGKEFTEVILFEGTHYGRFIRTESKPGELAQSVLALRVAITRAVSHTTILTPKNDSCPLL